MTAMPVAKRTYSLAEYYQLEAAAESRHEYHDGEILAMSGGSISHSQICVNLAREVSLRLKGSPCQAFESNLRSRIEASNRNVYPDLAVVCGPVERDTRDPSNGTIMNPRVVIEVISFLSRPISLSLRLFANMLGGHIALKVFGGFVVSLGAAGGLLAILAPLPLLMAVALTAFEIFVAALQAYVFMVLTCIYLNDALHPGH